MDLTRPKAALLGDASRSDGSGTLNVRACAVARVFDGNVALVLHCRVPGVPGERLSNFLQKLVGSKKFQERAYAERSMTVDDSSADPFSVHCLVPSGTSGHGFMLVLAITAKSYPRRMVFPPPVSDAESGPEGMLAQVAAEIVRECGANVLSLEAAAASGLRRTDLGGKVAQLMERMCAAYEDTAGKDKMRSLQAQVDEVHGVMQDNVNSMLRNQDQLEDLRGKVTTMGDNSKAFYGLARDNRRLQQCREYKLRLLIVAAAALVCLAFVLPNVMWLGSGGDEEPAPTPMPPPLPTALPTPAPAPANASLE